jgi:D-alanine--poly(phosphoribitol) ligase subunit 1
MAFISNMGMAFEDVLLLHGDRTALLYPADGRRISYADLGALSQDFMCSLTARGLCAGQVIALFHDKSPEAFALMIACLRLGIIYTNLDPESPPQRLSKILEVSQPKLLVNAFANSGAVQDLCKLAGCPMISLLDLAEVGVSGSAPCTNADLPGNSPAYLMFTSGSTGTPKGAVMSHANLIWFSAWTRDRFAIRPEDVLTNVNPMYFDNSVFDFYSAIFSGACLVPITSAQLRDTRGLVRLVNTAGCTLWFSVPSLLVYLLTTRALSSTDFPAMRSIAFGGEGFPKPKLRQLFDLLGHRLVLENVYGPTECTCICSSYRICEADFEDMQALAPLGKLAQNFACELIPVDPDRPDLAELFLRGPQVGLGYYRDPNRSARVFIQNPKHQDFADVGYLTGDLVAKDAQNRLHFKGRKDFQIKHMGYRIELEEVEAGLNSLRGVRESAAVYLQKGTLAGEIVAFVAADSSCSADSISSDLASVLPIYMRPKRIERRELLPKNANGKIDRQALLNELTAPIQ